MIKKNLVVGIVAGVLMALFVSTHAMAARIELTLGWHNMLAGDFYMVANESDQNFSNGDQIKGSKLNRSILGDPGGIHIDDLNLSGDGHETWSVDTSRKFDRWVDKKSNKALKKAAKNFTKDTTGRSRGWRSTYRNWQNEDLWNLYQNNEWVETAFNQMVEGSNIRGQVGGQRFIATMDIFANPAITDNPGPNPATPVPEPATMLLLGVGLLGTSVMGRKMKK